MSRRACVGGKHDTRQLPPNGFLFAPGVIEGPSRNRRRWLTPNRRAYLKLGVFTVLMTMAAAVICLALAGRL